MALFCVTLLDCLPIEPPPPKRRAASAFKPVKAKAQTKIDGFTPEQRFFLSWAQVWHSNVRPEALREQVQTDPHAPEQFRTIGPLQNMPEFYQAFGCREGAKMVRAQAERAKIW